MDNVNLNYIRKEILLLILLLISRLDIVFRMFIHANADESIFDVRILLLNSIGEARTNENTSDIQLRSVATDI